MKNLYLLCLLFLQTLLYSQTFDLAKNFNYGSINRGSGIGVDGANNIYIHGSYGLLMKYDSVGNLIWTDSLFNSGISVTDQQGNTYIVGQNLQKYNSNGTQQWIVTLPIGMFSGIALNSLGGIVIVGKTIEDTSKSILSFYDDNGSLLWARINEFPAGSGQLIKSDNGGNIYIVGSATVDSATGNHGFLAKYNNIGSLLYIKPIPATVNDMAIDKSNNIYIGGWYSLFSINILGTAYSANNSNNPVPQFVIKYDPNGNVLWYKIITGELGAGGIATDNENNFYLTNSYTTLNVGALSLSAPYSNSTNLFIMKTDSAGTMLWYRNSVARIEGASAGCDGSGITVADNGTIWITGQIGKMQEFGSQTLNQTSSYGDLLLLSITSPNVAAAVNEQVLNVQDFNIFPNPGEGFFQLNYKVAYDTDIQINIYNSAGLKIRSITTENKTKQITENINLSNESKGVYYLEVIENKKKTVRKISLN